MIDPPSLPRRDVRRSDAVRSRLLLPTSLLDRRRFLTLAGGLSLAACSGVRASTDSANRADSTDPAESRAPAPPTSDAGAITATVVPDGSTPNDRVVVVVALDGGNDAVNTLVPDLGSYHDLRPGIALADDDLLASAALPGHGLHAALAPLLPHLEMGTTAVVAGVGFPDPDRSHFTSIERWDRADRMDDGLGWLGRWFDTVGTDLSILSSVALGGGGAMQIGATSHPAAIGDVNAFAFPAGVSNGDIRALAEDGVDDDPLRAAARAAFASSVGAVEEFDAIADAVRGEGGGAASAQIGGTFSTGLAVAAELIRSDSGTRVVTVRANGFDTHSNQVGQHETLLADLAGGLADFWTTLDQSGDAERVLLLTTSEFGRRAAENGSGGTDHGAAGLSFVMGPSVQGGLHGAIDTDALVDGDLAASIDPRTLYTSALDWLGADVEHVLGARWSDVPLLVG